MKNKNTILLRKYLPRSFLVERLKKKKSKVKLKNYDAKLKFVPFSINGDILVNYVYFTHGHSVTDRTTVTDHIL